MRKLFFTILLFYICFSTYAQKQLIIKADSLVSAFYFKSGFDTAYVSRPKKRFMVALHPDFSSVGIRIGNGEKRALFSTDFSDKTGVFFTYRGYGFGYSFKPRRGRKNDGEFNFRFFCRRFGIETDWCRATSFAADIDSPDTSFSIQRGDIDFKMRMFSVYYVFNNTKFSFPAAFDKSYTQIKSCGSILLGASFASAKMKTGRHDFDIYARNSGIGAGYGYNFVTKKKFLIHISVIPTFMFWEENEVKTTSGRLYMDHSYTDLCIWGRAAASYNFKRMFVGMDYVLYATLLGDRKDISTRFSRNITRFFAGFWF
ncbi:MAG: DUF4421 domain-containing protein [Bacteroidales bacterium]|nr:DUF4421 domain-containing protein [Bacteroidales bacterium]